MLWRMSFSDGVPSNFQRGWLALFDSGLDFDHTSKSNFAAFQILQLMVEPVENDRISLDMR